MTRMCVLLTAVLLTIELTPCCHGRVASYSSMRTHLNEADKVAKDVEGTLLDEELQLIVGRIKTLVDERHQKGSADGLTQAQRDTALKLHNELRKGENAGDMFKLQYNDDLEKLAQKWASGCSWGHRPSETFKPSEYGFGSVGENIWAWPDDSKTIPDQPIQDWFDEKKNYNVSSFRCADGTSCGHYTAIVWATTHEIGCGVQICPSIEGTDWKNAVYFVCNYGPGGNDGNSPYSVGKACSSCGTGKFYCTDDLCDASCKSAGSDGTCACNANCVHGTKTSDCTCTCDVGYMGVSCDEVCADSSTLCGDNNGWPQFLCNSTEPDYHWYHEQVNKHCFKMCGKCTTSKPDVVEMKLLETLKKRVAEEKKIY